MKRTEMENVLKKMLKEDWIGNRRLSLHNDEREALKMALSVLNGVCCGECKCFVEEDILGNGWCGMNDFNTDCSRSAFECMEFDPIDNVDELT